MDSLKLKNSLALVAGLFAIHLSISFAHPVPPSSTDGVVEHKISNSQPFAHNNTTTGQDDHEAAEASSEPFVLTAEAFPMDRSVFNITRSFINQFHSDPFTPASMEGPLTTDIPENTTPLPVNEEVSETVPEEERSVNVLESLLLDSERDTVAPSTDVTVDLTSLMPTEEPELQYATPFVPKDLLHLHMSVSTSPTDVSFTKGVVESRDFSSSIKLLSEQETVSGIVGDYLIPPVDVPESQSTTSFELSGHIPATSTASPVTVASAQVPNSKELDLSNQASLTPDTVAQPVFSTSDNPTSMTLPTETSRKTSVETLDALHPSIHLQTAVRKFVDMNPFLFNPTWPAEMGFHSIPEQRMTQSFGNQRSTFQTKMKPYRRMLPEFQLDPPLYHSFSPQVHPVQLRYRQPVSDGHPRAPYPHPHDNNNAIHRSFESASPKSRMFAFPGISSTRENFRFRVNWIDEITPAGSA